MQNPILTSNEDELKEVYQRLRKLSNLNTRTENVAKITEDELLNRHINTSVYPVVLRATGAKYWV